VHEHAAGIARTLRYLGVPRGDIDDAVQEVFVVAYRRISDLEQPERVSAWLRGVAVNVARNRRRARRRSPIVSDIEPPDIADAHVPESLAAANELRARLLSLLDSLPDEQRAALVLFEIENVPMKVVATTLGISLATVYRRLEDARETLRAALRDFEGERM
jgi:RNA polymerase sigma-70 factor (ECF subfamily)